MFTSKYAEELWNHPARYSRSTGSPFLGCKARIAKLTTHFHLPLGLGMSGAVTPLPRVLVWRAQGQTFPIERNHVLQKIKEVDLNEAKKEKVDKDVNSGIATRWEIN